VLAYAPSLTSCIFSGNGQNNELLLSFTAFGMGFRLTDCVFSGPLPNALYLAEVNNVVANAVTASFVLHHFYSHYCPSQHPPCTASLSQSRSPTASSPFTMAMEFGARRKLFRLLLSDTFLIPISCAFW
jgi:hypothetical protein